MADTRWKRHEREIASTLGGSRLPNSGRGQCDVRCPGWAVQIKTRLTLAAWLEDAMDQAARDAGPNESAAVVLSEARQGVKARRLVVLDLDTFARLIRAARDCPEIAE